MLIEAFGDDALIARTGDPQDVVEARAERLRAEGAFEEVVPTLGTLMVVFTGDEATARRTLAAALRVPVSADGRSAAPLTISIAYDGDDLAMVCERLGLTPAAFADAHAAGDYAVQFLGFTPGFAYLGGLPDALRGVPRLDSPRTRLPGGSVGITGDRCGVYALPGPGGWPVIGRTSAELFRTGQASPFALVPGQRVRFEPVR